MWKRALACALAICLVCCLTVVACASGSADELNADFGTSDAKVRHGEKKLSAAGTAYEDALRYCADHGILDVIDDTASDTTVPRNALLRIMYKALEQTENSNSTVPFITSVVWAVKNGSLRDQGTGIIGKDAASREQAIAMLWRGAGSPACSASVDADDIADVSDWAKEAVHWARSQNLLKDIESEGAIDLKKSITVGETTSLLYRYMEEPKKAQTSLVAYFSATGTVQRLAQKVANITGSALYEIIPEQPYTSQDLAYHTDSRADREQNDPLARPGIVHGTLSPEAFDVIYLGYPIWHGRAPRIISTFLESWNFAGKTIVPFCTSHASGIGQSAAELHSSAPDATWLKGQRFAADASDESVSEWLKSLDLPDANNTSPAAFDLASGTVTLNSGFKMPINGLGTYSLTGDTAFDAVKAALANGVRLIDTAHVYGNEDEIGRAIRESIDELGISREEIFVTTKIYPGTDMQNPEAAIQGCLDRLDIGYVDLMLLHHPDPNDVKAYKAMEEFVRNGSIRSIGLSNWYVDELESFLPQVTIKPAVVQNEIHPYYQENNVIPYIQDQGIVVEGWYPFGGRGHTAELLGNEVISEIAAAHGVSPAQVILRWNLQKGVVVIPGSSNPDHILENTQLYHFELADEEMERINALDRNEKHDWY